MPKKEYYTIRIRCSHCKFPSMNLFEEDTETLKELPGIIESYGPCPKCGRGDLSIHVWGRFYGAI